MFSKPPLWPFKTLESFTCWWLKSLSSGGTLRRSLLISEMSFFKNYLGVYAWNWRILQQPSCYSYEQMLWRVSCFNQMFSGFGCSVFTFMTPKQQLPTFKIIYSVWSCRYWLRRTVWMFPGDFTNHFSFAAECWKFLCWSFTYSTERTITSTGSFSYRRGGKQQQEEELLTVALLANLRQQVFNKLTCLSVAESIGVLMMLTS